MEERTWRPLNELCAEQHKINEEVNAYCKRLIKVARELNNGNADAAADIVEEHLINTKIDSPEWRHWFHEYSKLMKAARNG